MPNAQRGTSDGAVAAVVGACVKEEGLEEDACAAVGERYAVDPSAVWAVAG